MQSFLKAILKGSASILTLIPIMILGQGLVINEIVSSNHGSLFDEDNETPDWIELYNGTNAPINLAGYGLSDDFDEPYKWTFLNASIPANDYLIAFASDKDRQGTNITWDLILSEGDPWKYFVGSSQPPAGWNENTFDDASWSEGNSGFGYGDNDDNTTIPTTMSVFLRHEFSVDDNQSLLFHMDYDDAYIAYLNGVEFSRANIGTPGSPASYNTPASTYTEPVLIQGGQLAPTTIPEEIMLEGENVLAIQVHNYSLSSSDLTAIPFLSQVAASGTHSNLPAYLLLPPQAQNHTNFKISASGEELLLTPPSGENTDLILAPPLPADISYGRESDGSNTFHFFNFPTPNASNSGGFPALATAPEISPSPGFFTTSVTIDFGSIPPGVSHRYTTDASTPTTSSPIYSAPLTITSNTILKVLTSTADGLNTKLTYYSYFVNETTHLPIISLSFDPADFFSEDSGIYVMGTGASSDFPFFGANFWEDWERPIHIEFFETGQSLTYAVPGGAKIFGGWSRGNAQRSLALFARGEYGANEFDFPFFPDLNFDKFEALVLRNSGNDWQSSSFRDGLLTGLIADRNIEHQAFQPVEVFLNGQYWGIYNLREKVNEHFIASHFNIDADNLNLLETSGIPLQGDNATFEQLTTYINTHDLIAETEFEYVRERIDISNFINYQLAQIYFDNRDWPGNNIKFWSSRSAGSKWRWILYDTDFGFGIWNPQAYFDNTLEFATAPNGPNWPNPPWSTLFLRKFLNNDAFKNDFILTACDLLNGPFTAPVVHSAIERHEDWITSAIPYHFSRWNQNDMANWQQQISNMENFAQNRPAHMRSHFQNYFALGSLNQITVNVQPGGAGQVRVHSLEPHDYPWSGNYYSNIPLDIQALPGAGYVFSHWEETGWESQELLINILNTTSLTAVFVEGATITGEIVINEINYHSTDDSDTGDWLELYNGMSTALDLSDWQISDSNEDNLFDLGRIILEPDQYLIVCNDSSAFRTVHGPMARVVGNFDFNFSNGGELVRLFNNHSELMDSVRYDDNWPWPTEADGDGPTLELLHPNLDNALSTSWLAAVALGTPGQRNSRFTVAIEPDESLGPQDLQMSLAYPNPFNAQVTIPYQTRGNGEVNLKIFNIQGQLVHSNTGFQSGAGQYNLVWNGKNDAGLDCASGIYIIRLIYAQQMDNIRVALVR